MTLSKAFYYFQAFFPPQAHKSKIANLTKVSIAEQIQSGNGGREVRRKRGNKEEGKKGKEEREERKGGKEEREV